MFNCIIDTVEDSSSVRSYRKFLIANFCYKYTHPFNGPFSGTNRVGRYQKGKTNLDFTEARDSEWQWHQLGHMQVCTLLQTDNHASTPPLKFFTGRMPFLLPNQQRQSTEGQIVIIIVPRVIITHVLIIVTLSRKRSRADLL